MDYEPSIKRFFENFGYCVEKIAESDKESPDFLIFDDTSSYLLELKTKFPSDSQIKERRRMLYAGEFHNVHELIIGKNRLSGIIKKAQDQLQAHKQKEEVLCLVWLLATGHLAEPRIHQFRATLYGSTFVIDGADTERSGECFFFYNSDFFRYRDVLDAAVVSTESQANLFLNPLSPRYEQMKHSSLPKHLGKAVVDPIGLEKEGKAFLVDGDVNRSNKEAVLLYLRGKYKSEEIVDITMNYLSGDVAFPRDI